jgi:DNA-binding NarL/FixJ family response regulator
VAGITTSAASATRLIAGHEVHLVLMDLRLMGGTTNGLIHGLRGGPHADLPHVVVLAERLDDPLLLHALRGGADAFQLGLDGLADTLRRTLGGQSPITQDLARQVLNLFDNTSPDAGDALAATPLQLTASERRLLAQLARGDTLQRIGEMETMSLHTLGMQVRGIYRKLRWLLRAGALTLEGGAPGAMDLQLKPLAGRNR